MCHPKTTVGPAAPRDLGPYSVVEQINWRGEYMYHIRICLSYSDRHPRQTYLAKKCSPTEQYTI